MKQKIPKKTMVKMLGKALLAAIALLGLLSVGVSSVKVGDEIPSDVELHFGFPPENINLSKRIAGKKVILVGLPGAVRTVTRLVYVSLRI